MNLMCAKAATLDKNGFTKFMNDLDRSIRNLDETEEIADLNPKKLAESGIGFSPMEIGIVASNRPEILAKLRGTNG